MSRLGQKYETEIKGALSTKYGYKNVNMIPKIEKVVVSCVHRDTVSNAKVVDSIVADLSSITGQKPVVARAKKSIASFKIREGMPLGASVTLRGERMFEFLDRLISISLPRVRDFRGISPKGFDGRGNFNMGLKEQIIFPEINYDKIDKIRGMGITIVTSAKSNEEGKELLTLLGMPFASK